MRLDDLIDLLRALPLFRAAEAEALRLLAFSGVRRNLRPGDVLFRKGEIGDGAYLVLSGEIVLDPSGDGAPTDHRAGPGMLIGQSALFTMADRPVTALARSNGAVLFLARDLMTKVLEAHPRSAALIAAELSTAARGMADQLSRLKI